MKQEPVIEQLLPLPADRLRDDSKADAHRWDYIYEPDAQAVLDELLVALRRGARLPGGGREHGVRAVGAHGRDEVGDRQRRRTSSTS